MQKIFFLLSSLIIMYLDLYSKQFFSLLLKEKSITIFWEFMLKLQYNEGVAFSIPLKWIFQIIISFIVLIILITYNYKEYQFKNWISTIAVSFITWWALWNLYERIFKAEVTDFIQVFDWFPVFNIADSFICLGVIILLYDMYFIQWKIKN